MHSKVGETGFGQSLAIHRAVRVLQPNKGSNRASFTVIESGPLWLGEPKVKAGV